ncbi:hypothetical protein LEN26_005936 [Aphanomyces euteiches]|nr:hypothetical protein AeMF1_021666 [Aphanomyces euteiches]KAH9137114.1 hypothetical protein LEN26_005936 [Aphanomyces euteiches]KAH9189611.1 hypothetical protein AeNC1_008405 [Aphanomyces euteiches]
MEGSMAGVPPTKTDALLSRVEQLVQDYSVLEYPLTVPFTTDSFQLDETVFVSTSTGKTKNTSTEEDPSNGTSTGRLFARAKVIDTSPAKYPGRVKIEYRDGSTYHVAPSRLTPQLFRPSGHPFKTGVLVSAKTDHYRRLAKTQILPSDIVLEIGCDLGITVDSIAECVGVANVVGVDKSHESIQVAKQTYPHCQFVEMDIFHSRDELLALAAKCTKILIDINGNRLLEAVLNALALVLDGCPRVELIIVKSVELHQQVLKLHKH